MNAQTRYVFSYIFAWTLIVAMALVLIARVNHHETGSPTADAPVSSVRVAVEAYYAANPLDTVPNDYLALYDYVQRHGGFSGVAGEGATDAQVAEAMYSVRAQLSGVAYSAVALSYADARGAMHSQLCRLVAGSAPAQYVCAQS